MASSTQDFRMKSPVFSTKKMIFLTHLWKRRATPSWVASPPRWLCYGCPSRRTAAWMRHGPPISGCSRPNKNGRYPWENDGKWMQNVDFSSIIDEKKTCRLENRRIFMCLPIKNRTRKIMEDRIALIALIKCTVYKM